jgi:hypothetical protein
LHSHVAAYFLLYWCEILYFILWVEVIQNLNLIWIQISLQFIKDLKLEKVFLFFSKTFGPKPSFPPESAQLDPPSLFSTWPNRSPTRGPVQLTSFPLPNPTRPGLRRNPTGVNLKLSPSGKRFPSFLIPSFSSRFEFSLEIKLIEVLLCYELVRSPINSVWFALNFHLQEFKP